MTDLGKNVWNFLKKFLLFSEKKGYGILLILIIFSVVARAFKYNGLIQFIIYSWWIFVVIFMLSLLLGGIRYIKYELPLEVVKVDKIKAEIEKLKTETEKIRLETGLIKKENFDLKNKKFLTIEEFEKMVRDYLRKDLGLNEENNQKDS